MNTVHKSLALALGMTLGLAALAAANHPEPRHMSHVGRLAYDVEADSEYMLHAAERERFHDRGHRRRVLGDLRGLLNAAHEFSEAVDEHYRQPRHTEHAFDVLERAYRDAHDSLDHPRRNRATREVRARLADSISVLHAYYEGDRDGREHWRRLDHLARLAERGAENVYRHARSEERGNGVWIFGHDSSRALRRLDDLRDEAEDFRKAVRRARGRRGSVLGAYEDLLDDYDRAEDRIHAFSSHVDREFHELGDLLDEISESLAHRRRPGRKPRPPRLRPREDRRDRDRDAPPDSVVPPRRLRDGREAPPVSEPTPRPPRLSPRKRPDDADGRSEPGDAVQPPRRPRQRSDGRSDSADPTPKPPRR